MLRKFMDQEPRNGHEEMADHLAASFDSAEELERLLDMLTLGDGPPFIVHRQLVEALERDLSRMRAWGLRRVDDGSVAP